MLDRLEEQQMHSQVNEGGDRLNKLSTEEGEPNGLSWIVRNIHVSKLCVDLITVLLTQKAVTAC